MRNAFRTGGGSPPQQRKKPAQDAAPADPALDEQRAFPVVRKGVGEKRQHVVIDRLDLDRWIEKRKVA